MKTHKQLPIPSDSAWGRKSHNPIVVLRRAIYKKWPHGFLDRNMDKYIFDPLYNVKNGLINFWTWKSVIWKDRHWDGHYIFEVLKHKLILQRKELVSANRHTSIPQINRDITICLKLIERIQEDYYAIEYMDYHQWDFSWVMSEILDMEDNEPKLGTLLDYFEKYPIQFKKLKARNLRKPEHYLALLIASENQKRCQALLFRILSERINGWWD